MCGTGGLVLCVWRGADCVQLTDKTIGLCPHVVAVAELLGKLQGLLSCVQKKIPSLTHLTTTMPRSGTSRGSVRVSCCAKNSLGNCSTYTVTTGHRAAVVAGPGSMQAGVDDHFGVGPPVMPSVYQPQFTNIVQPLPHLFHTMPKRAYLQCHTQMHH